MARKIAFITGASRGIGKASAQAFLDIPLEAIQKIFEGNVFSQLHITQLSMTREAR